MSESDKHLSFLRAWSKVPLRIFAGRGDVGVAARVSAVDPGDVAPAFGAIGNGGQSILTGCKQKEEGRGKLHDASGGSARCALK